MNALPDLSVLAAFTLAAIFLTLTPGPDMTLFLGKTMTGGRAAGLAAFAGASTGLLVHTTLAALGLSALLAASATGFTILKVAGCAYLLYLAVEAVRNGTAFSLDAGARAREPLGRVYGKGLAINLLNPKIIVFFLTFLPQFVAAGDPHATARMMFLGLWFIVTAIPISVALIFTAGRFAAFLKRSPRAVRAFDWGFACVMTAFAIRLVTAQGRH